MGNAGQMTFSIGLNVSAFLGAMRGAIGLVLSYKAVMKALAGASRAIALGDELTHLSSETGEAISSLLVMRQAFESVGLSSGDAQTSLRLMRRSLSGISEAGQRTEGVFAALGLDIESLRTKDALTQFQTIGEAISQLSNHSDKVNAAMTIFGRSGSGMLRIFNDPKAFKKEEEGLGSAPGIIEKYAPQMEEIGTIWARVMTSMKGSFYGAIGPMLPALEAMVTKINSIDFAKIGAGFSAALGAAKDVFREIDPMEFAIELSSLVHGALSGAVRAALSLLVSVSFWKGVGMMMIGALAGLGAALMKVFSPVVAFLGASILLALDKLKAGIAKIPGLKKYVEGHQPLSFREHYENELRGQVNFANASGESAEEIFKKGAVEFGKAKSLADQLFSEEIEASKAGSYFSGLGRDFNNNFAARMEDVLASAVPEPTGSGDQEEEVGTPETGKARSYGKSEETPSDQWARVGAFVGGAIDRQVADNTKVTARYTSLLHRSVTRIAAIISNPPQPATM